MYYFIGYRIVIGHATLLFIGATKGNTIYWAVALDTIHTPWLRLLTASTLKNSTKLHSPLKTYIKYGSASKKYGFTPEEFRERVIYSLFTLGDFVKN